MKSFYDDLSQPNVIVHNNDNDLSYFFRFRIKIVYFYFGNISAEFVQNILSLFQQTLFLPNFFSW
jgi:hypothetical protein